MHRAGALWVATSRPSSSCFHATEYTCQIAMDGQVTWFYISCWCPDWQSFELGCHLTLYYLQNQVVFYLLSFQSVTQICIITLYPQGYISFVTFPIGETKGGVCQLLLVLLPQLRTMEKLSMSLRLVFEGLVDSTEKDQNWAKQDCKKLNCWFRFISFCSQFSSGFWGLEKSQRPIKTGWDCPHPI